MKQDIRFYDFEFNLVYIISDWISLNWELKYNDIGTFELQLQSLSGIIEMLDANPYLVAVQGEKQAIITGRQYEDNITIYGRTPNWLLSKRIVMPFEMGMKVDIEVLIRRKLGEVFDNSDSLVLADAIGGFEVLEEFAVKSPKSMLTFITENTEALGVGHRLIFEPLKHRWLFELYRGEERSLIISEANKNADSPKYTGDILDMADGLCYKDKDTGEYATLSATNRGILRWYSIGKADNNQEAVNELKSLKENSTLSYESTLLTYGTDYNLGDIFYVETEFGGKKIRKACRVKSVRLWEEALNSGERPEFEEKEADEDAD